jgi:hypothetical protein
MSQTCLLSFPTFLVPLWRLVVGLKGVPCGIPPVPSPLGRAKSQWGSGVAGRPGLGRIGLGRARLEGQMATRNFLGGFRTRPFEVSSTQPVPARRWSAPAAAPPPQLPKPPANGAPQHLEPSGRCTNDEDVIYFQYEEAPHPSHQAYEHGLAGDV